MSGRAFGGALPLALLACSTPAHPAADGALRTSGTIRFEVYESAVCGDAGPSPLGRCSRAVYVGGLVGHGDTAIQRMEALQPEGMFYVAENDLIRLADGELRSRVNAVFHARSEDLEVASLHAVTGGTGRYAGASGHIRIWRASDALFGYEAVIHLAETR